MRASPHTTPYGAALASLLTGFAPREGASAHEVRLAGLKAMLGSLALSVSSMGLIIGTTWLIPFQHRNSLRSVPALLATFPFLMGILLFVIGSHRLCFGIPPATESHSNAAQFARVFFGIIAFILACALNFLLLSAATKVFPS